MTSRAEVESGTRSAPRLRAFFARVARPVVALATQGLAPSRLAATLAVGTVCSLFPFLGATSALNFLVALALRLNVPALQALNQLLGPLQLALILAYVRLGEWMWRATPQPLSLAQLLASFRQLSFADFLARFGAAGVHAFSGWLATAPVLFAVVYLPAWAIVRRHGRPRGGQSA